MTLGDVMELDYLANEIGALELGPEELGYPSEKKIDYKGLPVKIFQDGDDAEGNQAYSWEIAA